MPPNKQEPGPVMDIQRPNTLSSPPKDPTVIAPANPLGRPATMEYTRPRPQEPSAPTMAVPSEQQQRMNESPFQPAPKAKKSHKGLWISLILLMFIGIGGAGAYYYFMMMNNEDPAPAPAATQTETKTEETITVEATPEGVDATTQSIDKSLNSLNDTEDYNPNQVSNDSLGL